MINVQKTYELMLTGTFSNLKKLLRDNGSFFTPFRIDNTNITQLINPEANINEHFYSVIYKEIFKGAHWPGNRCLYFRNETIQH